MSIPRRAWRPSSPRLQHRPRRFRVGSPRQRRGSCISLAVFALLLPAWSALHAQTVAGHVLDSLSQRPVQTATVTLLDSAGVSVGSAETDDAGMFVLKAPRTGAYRLYVDVPAYHAFLGDTLSLDEGETVEALVRLQAAPVPLDAMSVTVARTEAHLRKVGFDLRRRFSMGYFVSPEQVEERKPQVATDLLRQVPRVRLVWDEMLHGYVITRTGTAQRSACLMKVVVDGTSVGLGDLDDIVPAQDVLAVEAYPNVGGVGAPPQYRGSDAYCGVVLVWTREG